MFSREARVRLFLAFLILVLVLVNSQSLQISYQTRELVEDLFQSSSQQTAEIVAMSVGEQAGASAPLSERDLSREAERHGLHSACVLDWDARLVTGGNCAPASGGAFDRLDQDGRLELLERGWVMTPVAPRYDDQRAESFGYLALPGVSEAREIGDTDVGSPGVLRIRVPASNLAAANRRFRTTVIYQVSALSLVLLVLLLFLNSLLAPQRQLVAEVRSVSTEMGGGAGEGDEAQFVLSTFQDVVRQLKSKEQELAALHLLEKARADEKEALASDIIHSMTTGLVSLDPSGCVVLVNPAAEEIFRVKARDVRGKVFKEVFAGSEELVALTEGALARGAFSLRGRARYRREDGGGLHLGVSVIPLLSGADQGDPPRPRGALCLLADLTEVIELRERLFLKENLARLGEMAAGIAHEFRNGLATILGNAKLLEAGEAADASEIVRALIEEGEALSRVVTEFLQFARPQALHLEVVDLGSLLTELVQDLSPMANQHNVRLILDTGATTIEADDILLRKALSNLIVNAIEALAESSASNGEVHIACATVADSVHVAVNDNGPGIPPEQRAQVFTPFFTGKSSGTGLGLSVVQKIAVLHNGSVELHHPPAGGASFLLKLPLRPDTAPTADWV